MSGRENVVLIGMPGVGKSTLGILLAKELGWHFCDTDVFIQALEGGRLQEIIDKQGIGAFREIEEKRLLALDVRSTVIATGGSAIYSEPAMQHLKKRALAVFLELSLEAIEQRLTNMASRGVVMTPGQTLQNLYDERLPLYKRYADLTVSCEKLNYDQSLESLITQVRGHLVGV